MGFAERHSRACGKAIQALRTCQGGSRRRVFLAGGKDKGFGWVRARRVADADPLAHLSDDLRFVPGQMLGDEPMQWASTVLPRSAGRPG